MRLEDPASDLLVGDCAILVVPHNTTLLVLLLENVWSNLKSFSQSEKLKNGDKMDEIGNKYLF